MTKYLFFINRDDAPFLMTKKFVDELDTFFDKTDKMLFLNIITGDTRIEVLPEGEKVEKKKCRNCGCDPYAVRDHSKDKVKETIKSKATIDGKLNADTGF